MSGSIQNKVCATTQRRSYRQQNDRYGCQLATCHGLAICLPAGPGFCEPGATSELQRREDVSRKGAKAQRKNAKKNQVSLRLPLRLAGATFLKNPTQKQKTDL